jgi:hypothetical protein
MKKIFLVVCSIIVFSSVEANAQTIFIPQPTVVNIPLLDPSRLMIQNEVFRNTVNGAAQKGVVKGAKTRPPAAAVDYTIYKPRQMNYIPKVLAQTGKGNAAEQRQAEQFYNSQIEYYEQVASSNRYPANDVAYALMYFIVNNYEIYYDLVAVPIEKDPWAKRAKDGFERLALLNKKRSRVTTPEEDRAIYFQLKDMLSAKPEFRKMAGEDKQKITETLAITYGVLRTSYLKAIDDEDERLINQAHEGARQNLEKLLGVSIDKIKINLSGLQLK